jgi:multicomponent Na+:H+ antiporter subunit F
MLMFLVTGGLILVSMTLILVRALKGPTVYDRVLAANSFGTNTVLMIAIISFISGRRGFIDLSLTYSMISFIGAIAILKFWEFGNFARPYVTRRREER